MERYVSLGPDKFKVGDQVKVVRKLNFNWNSIMDGYVNNGRFYRIDKVLSIEVNGHRGYQLHGHGWSFNESCLEIASDWD